MLFSNILNPKNAGITLTVLLSLLALFSYRSAALYPEHIQVAIGNKQENNFVNEGDIIEFIQQIGVNNPGIMQPEAVNLRRLEDSLLAVNFISEAQVARNLKGNLVVEIWQDSPLARVISATGKQGYVAENRTILPLSPNYTSRVLLLTGAGADSLFNPGFFQNTQGKNLFRLLTHIEQDVFWKAQIAQIDLDKNLNIEVYPQVGKQVFELGQAENFLHKLNKLNTFYKEIVPKKGWDAYKRVKLQYENQIVCE